jgi:hypothetical protein
LEGCRRAVQSVLLSRLDGLGGHGYRRFLLRSI